MIVNFSENGKIASIQAPGFEVPYTDRFGFFMGQTEVILTQDGQGYAGTCRGVDFRMEYMVRDAHLEIGIAVRNTTGEDICEKIGFHMGVDTYMVDYPQWHKPFFPTLLRCEKTHMWGYYMNTAQNALAVAAAEGIASYDIGYNMISEEDYGHRITGTDLVFFQNTPLPPRHPENLKCLKAGQTYRNTLYLIPVEKKQDILPTLARVTGLPMIRSEKFTVEQGEALAFTVDAAGDYRTELHCPDGSVCAAEGFVFREKGVYCLKVHTAEGRIGEALFFCREDWDFYLHNAAKEALAKPQIASTHVEGFYGLFSMFLSMKYFEDDYLNKKAYACFHEIMPLMFDFESCTPIVIPSRIQNTALLLSLLTDIYEADPEKNLHYLQLAAGFGDWIMQTQSEDGAYRNRNGIFGNRSIHYTCVVYVAKGLLELALAEKDCADPALRERYVAHYESVRLAVDELVRNLDNIDTEGELTLEDGMISCSALQIGMFALTLPEEERAPYIKAAEYMLGIHTCLEQQLIPDCRMNGGSLRYWESQYDVMIRANMFNSPHGWTGWTGYAHYYLYRLTGKKEHLIRLMNLLGSGAQLIDFDGNLRWSFCAQPYVRAKTMVPDRTQAVEDGYAFVDSREPNYRGKYEIREFGENYVDMISGWYRPGAQRVMGGYAFCPLYLKDGVTLDVDNQGGCCDNDVHEIFKCIEECVLRKAYIHENEDGSLLTYGCRAKLVDGVLQAELNGNVTEVIYNLRRPCRSPFGPEALTGFGSICL